jgi:hypothetical protein
MSSITDFIKDNKMISYPITFDNKLYDYTDDWDTLQFEHSQIMHLQFENKNGFIIDTLSGKNKYIIIDTDDEKSNKFILKIIKEYNLNIVSTPSYKNITFKNQHNNHYWFKVPNDYELEEINIKDHLLYGNIDIIHKIAEHKSTTINKNISELPLEILNNFKNQEINKICDLLILFNDDTGDKYEDWVKIGSSIKSIREDFVKIFDEFSSTREKYKGLSDVKKYWKGFKKFENGYGTLINMLKIDNPEDLKKWKNTYNNVDNDFYEKLEMMNQHDFSKIYYDLYPNKYIVSKSKQWYEYNEYNILINQNGIPSSLKNNISNILQNIIIEKRNELKPDDPQYKHKNQLIINAYKNVGCSSYTKGIIEYLEFLYINIDLDDLLDNNVNLLAFNNKVYDISIKNFRDIKPDDYITKTTKINMPTKYDKAIEDKIYDLLLDIFDCKENYEYWLKTTALSLFGNKYESCYILTGTGGNGKGLLSKILIKLFGDYLYTANNTFLTEKIKAGGANSTLANCKGIRYLLICEPDDGNDAEFNVDFIKAITGGDNITTRDLFKTNITYTPQFTPFIQCNKKPALGKMDNGIKRRLKIQKFKNTFVEKPDPKKNEKQANPNLKSSFNKSYYDTFMTILLKYASENYDKDCIDQPIDVINQTKDYFDSNNPVKDFIEDKLKVVEGKNTKFKDLYDKFKFINDKISKSRFDDDLIHNGLQTKTINGTKMVLNIVIKEIADE